MFLLSLFKQTWKVLWRHPSLWVYGMFLAILGQGGMSEVVLRALSTLYSVPRGARLSDILLEKDFWWVSSISVQNIPTLLLKGLGGLLALFGIFLSMAAIPLAVRAMVERRRVLSIQELLRSAAEHVLKVAALFVLSSVVFLLLLAPAVLLLKSVGDPTITVRLGEWTLVALLAAASAMVFFVALYATNAIVLGSYSLLAGIREGWSIFARHWVVSVECGLAFFVFNILAAQFTNTLIRPILTAAYLATLFLVGHGHTTAAHVTFIIVDVVFVTLVWVLLVSLYAAFQTIFWSLLYLQLSVRMAPKSRLHIFTEPKSIPRAANA